MTSLNNYYLRIFKSTVNLAMRGQIKEAGFSKVSIVEKEVDWHGVKITRTPGQHGNEGWAAQMGNVSGFIFQAENERTIYWTGDTIWCEPVKK